MMNPRIDATRRAYIAFAAAMVIFGLVVMFAEPLLRLGAFMMALAFSFQFWTIVTARGERKRRSGQSS